MRTFSLTVFALIALAVAEIAVFIAVGNLMGFGPTVLIMLATSMIGAFLLRRTGRKAWQSVRAAAEGGRPPGRQVVDGLLGTLGALLLVVPGFITDIAGVLFLAPPTRGAFRGLVERVASRRFGGPAVGEFFGPRTVKIKQGRPASRVDSDQAPIEGEIV